MMSLSESIQTYKDITNVKIQCPRTCRQSCGKCMEEHEQLIDWLEELKELRILYSKVKKESYNNAIDSTLRILKFYKDEWNGIYKAIEEIENLKECE